MAHTLSPIRRCCGPRLGVPFLRSGVSPGDNLPAIVLGWVDRPSSGGAVVGGTCSGYRRTISSFDGGDGIAEEMIGTRRRGGRTGRRPSAGRFFQEPLGPFVGPGSVAFPFPQVVIISGDYIRSRYNRQNANRSSRCEAPRGDRLLGPGLFSQLNNYIMSDNGRLCRFSRDFPARPGPPKEQGRKETGLALVENSFGHNSPDGPCLS